MYNIYRPQSVQALYSSERISTNNILTCQFVPHSKHVNIDVFHVILKGYL
jgi:hypothetical protein